MSDSLPACPECAESFTYELGAMLVCPMCGHEWAADAGDGHDIDATVPGFGRMALKSSVVKRCSIARRGLPLSRLQPPR